ncbi:MAG: hypothetical protein JO129_00395 [Candidatus Dependentiae bacterium]|nr:hypothetical protein [Candidatus Dependentiae bacterium]
MIFIIFLCMSFSLYGSIKQQDIIATIRPIDISKIPDSNFLDERKKLFKENMPICKQKATDDELDLDSYEYERSRAFNQKVASLLGNQKAAKMPHEQKVAMLLGNKDQVFKKKGCCRWSSS